MKDLVSIVMPCFNSETHIKESINSIIAQTYQSWELLIVDDGSSDNTVEIINNFQKIDDRITLLKRNREPKCAATSRNIGLEYSKGEFIIFFDSDDILATFCLEQRVEEFKRNNVYDLIVFKQFEYCHNISNKVPCSKFHRRDHNLHILATSFMWQTMAPIWKRTFLLEIGGFDEDYKIFDDDGLNFKAINIHKGKFNLVSHLPEDSYYRNPFENKSRDYFLTGSNDLNLFIKKSIDYIKSIGVVNRKTKSAFSAVYTKYLIYSFQSEKVEKDEMLNLLNILKEKSLIYSESYKYFNDLIVNSSAIKYASVFENSNQYVNLWKYFHLQTSLIKYTKWQRKMRKLALRVLK